MTASLADLLYSTGEWSWLARDGWRCVSLALEALHRADGPPRRQARTALSMLGPWAPPDGRAIDVRSA